MKDVVFFLALFFSATMLVSGEKIRLDKYVLKLLFILQNPKISHDMNFLNV